MFAQDDWLKDGRRKLLNAGELFVEIETNGGNAKQLAELKELFPYRASHNSEQSSAELLFQITRNTGFETNKGNLGNCFINNCCDWTLRQADDMCGLDNARLDSNDKKREIVSRSMLKAAFEKAGL